MKLLLLANRVGPILAQSTGSLAEGASKAMLIGFIFGTICVVGRRLRTKLGITARG